MGRRRRYPTLGLVEGVTVEPVDDLKAADPTWLATYQGLVDSYSTKGFPQTAAEAFALKKMQTCSKCHGLVSAIVGRENRVLRADGGADHLQCAGYEQDRKEGNSRMRKYQRDAARLVLRRGDGLA